MNTLKDTQSSLPLYVVQSDCLFAAQDMNTIVGTVEHNPELPSVQTYGDGVVVAYAGSRQPMALIKGDKVMHLTEPDVQLGTL